MKFGGRAPESYRFQAYVTYTYFGPHACENFSSSINPKGHAAQAESNCAGGKFKGSGGARLCEDHSEQAKIQQECGCECVLRMETKVQMYVIF